MVQDEEELRATPAARSAASTTSTFNHPVVDDAIRRLARPLTRHRWLGRSAEPLTPSGLLRRAGAPRHGTWPAITSLL